MKKSKFSDSQIIDTLKRAESGVAVPGSVPGRWDQFSDVLQVASQVRWDGYHP